MTTRFVKEFDTLTEGRPATRHLSLVKLSEAIKEDAKFAAAAAKALDEREAARPVKVRIVSTPEDDQIELVYLFRQLHRSMDKMISGC